MMMKITKIFILLIIIAWSLDLTFSSFSVYENQIKEGSSIQKVQKLQEVFKWLWLYNWKINWNYYDIEDELLNFQKKSWIIKYNDDYWAWYFWDKTITALSEQFWDKFEKLKEEYLRIDEPYEGDRYFYVTAYYSPLPWQNRYTTWSYSWDVRLNWGWKITASWKPVYTWILAAPRNYAYWTKIYLEWVWIWVVEDRWWAIVNSWERWHEYDRIDVWMWYWDAWLERALKWWKRKIKWQIVPDYKAATIEFDKSLVSNFDDLKLDVDNPNKTNVKNAQKVFSNLWLYDGELNWNYTSLRDTLIKFQVDNSIISSSNSEAAWYLWPKTLIALRQKYNAGIFIEKTYSPWDWIIISNSNKKNLITTSNKINSLLNNQYKSKITIEKKKNSIRLALKKVINSSNSTIQKNKLRYLSEIL